MSISFFYPLFSLFAFHISYPWAYLEPLKLKWSFVDLSSICPWQIMGKSAAENVFLDLENSYSSLKTVGGGNFIWCEWIIAVPKPAHSTDPGEICGKIKQIW